MNSKMSRVGRFFGLGLAVCSCQDMPDVFYESCDDMMDQAGWLSDLFSKGDIQPTVLCDMSGICGAQGAQALFAASKKTLGFLKKALAPS